MTETAKTSPKAAPSKSGAETRLWLIVVVLALGTFATGTDSFVTVGILPRISGDLHVSVGRGGQLVTLFAWAYAIGSPVLMTLTARFARKSLLSVAILAFGLVNLSVVFIHSFAMLAFTRIIAAAFAAIYVPCAAVAAAMIAPAEKRGRALALVIGGSSLSTVLGVPAGIWIANGFDSWHAAFVFVAILAFAAFVGVRLMLPSIPLPPAVKLSERFGVLKDWSVLRVLLVTCAAMTGGFTVFTYLAEILAPVAPPTGGRLQWLVFAFGVASIFGSWVAGYGADRWGSELTSAVALIVLVANFLIFKSAVESLAGAFITMAVWGVAGWGFLPSQQHRLVRLAPTSPNIVISLNSTALYVGIALGSSIGGYLVSHSGGIGHLSLWGAAFDAAALLLSVAPLLMRRLRSGQAAQAAQGSEESKEPKEAKEAKGSEASDASEEAKESKESEEAKEAKESKA